jgi:hypothetical protein
VESHPCAKNAQGWGTQRLWVGHPPKNAQGWGTRRGGTTGDYPTQANGRLEWTRGVSTPGLSGAPGNPRLANARDMGHPASSTNTGHRPSLNRCCAVLGRDNYAITQDALSVAIRRFHSKPGPTILSAMAIFATVARIRRVGAKMLAEKLMDSNLKFVAIVLGVVYVLYMIGLSLYAWSMRHRTDEEKRKDEQEMIVEMDKMFKAKDDPNEAARWVP